VSADFTMRIRHLYKSFRLMCNFMCKICRLLAQQG
jgi:hypothetical protein